MVAPPCGALTLLAPDAAFIPLPNESPPPRGNISTPPNPPGPTLTNPPSEQNNDEFDSPPSEITPPSRDLPAKVAPAVLTTVELAEHRRAVAWSKCKVARLSAVAEGAVGAGV
jgi:hypothetical protein